jgi:hypothetical protein
MRRFLQRLRTALLTGYILVYYGELVFWATPDREGMGLGSLVASWFVYSIFAYFFLCVAHGFRARNPWAVFLAGAFFGWFEEGIVLQTTYGSADGPFPMSIPFTGLAWHALIGVFVGWYGVRRVLQQNRLPRTLALACAIGLFYGLWAIFWWTEPPAPMKALFDAGRTDEILLHFALFSGASTALLAATHWQLDRRPSSGFPPGRIEIGVLTAITLVYFATVTVPAAPKALWVMPPLMALTLGALECNRRREPAADISPENAPPVRPTQYLALFAIPLVAIAIYALALANRAQVRTNEFVYVVFSAVSTLFWLVSVVVLFTRSRRTKVHGERPVRNRPAHGP